MKAVNLPIFVKFGNAKNHKYLHCFCQNEASLWQLTFIAPKHEAAAAVNVKQNKQVLTAYRRIQDLNVEFSSYWKMTNDASLARNNL